MNEAQAFIATVTILASWSVATTEIELLERRGLFHVANESRPSEKEIWREAGTNWCALFSTLILFPSTSSSYRWLPCLLAFITRMQVMPSARSCKSAIFVWRYYWYLGRVIKARFSCLGRHPLHPSGSSFSSAATSLDVATSSEAILFFRCDFKAAVINIWLYVLEARMQSLNWELMSTFLLNPYLRRNIWVTDFASSRYPSDF